jgi:hypothetical protein
MNKAAEKYNGTCTITQRDGKWEIYFEDIAACFYRKGGGLSVDL